jgi:hypothetical protein
MRFIRYLRDEDGRPFGCVVAILVDLNISIPLWGASLCNPRDRFVRKRAREIAIGRAWKNGAQAAMFSRAFPHDRTVALENAVRLIVVDIDARDRWRASHPK